MTIPNNSFLKRNLAIILFIILPAILDAQIVSRKILWQKGETYCEEVVFKARVYELSNPDLESSLTEILSSHNTYLGKQLDLHRFTMNLDGWNIGIAIGDPIEMNYDWSSACYQVNIIDSLAECEKVIGVLLLGDREIFILNKVEEFLLRTSEFRYYTLERQYTIYQDTQKRPKRKYPEKMFSPSTFAGEDVIPGWLLRIDDRGVYEITNSWEQLNRYIFQEKTYI